MLLEDVPVEAIWSEIKIKGKVKTLVYMYIPPNAAISSLDDIAWSHDGKSV